VLRDPARRAELSAARPRGCGTLVVRAAWPSVCCGFIEQVLEDEEIPLGRQQAQVPAATSAPGETISPRDGVTP
jgi:hypothetical protein